MSDLSKLLKWLAIIFYKLFCYSIKRISEKPVGIPLQRDPNAICEYYEPGKRGQYMFDDCETDGHYLCKNCCHNIINSKL